MSDSLAQFPSHAALPGVTPAIRYPETRTGDQVDTYSTEAGTVLVPDPYRWLEDDRSPETEAWVREQNDVTFDYLAALPSRHAFRARITELLNYPRLSQPEQKRNWLLFSRNDGLQNQAVIYLQEGELGEPAILLDPNMMSSDGTTRIGALVFDRSGSRIAFTVSAAGSDWQEIRVLDTATRLPLADVVRWVKVSDIAWHGNGFFYSRYPEPAEDSSALSASNDDHQVFYHTLGTDQGADQLVFRDERHGQRFHTVSTSEDEQFAVLYISDRGQGKDGSALWCMNLTAAQPQFRSLWNEFDDQMSVINNVGDKLLVLTNRHAPNRRIVLIDPDNPDESAWTTVVPEREEPLEGAATGGGKLFLAYLKDVASRVYVHSMDGRLEGEIALPGIGTAAGFSGESDATSVFYSFASFTAPPTVYRYNIRSGESTLFRAPALPFNPAEFESTQVFVPSKDGTPIPAFVVARQGLKLDGTNPTLVYGYGGFNVSLVPTFSAARVAFLEQGGVYVQTNLRGGGEYGEAWHQAGMKHNKQNVFDDFTAIIEWLVNTGYTRHDRIAIQGGSNGGLLVGAIMTQQPALVKVALPSVGVMDMLRFHKFTIGWNWIADYGSSDNPHDFGVLHSYSPLHNLRDGVAYPATLITTGDHDDRVVPAHSFKFAARLQEANASENPMLIRVEVKSGHGSSSLTKAIDETADVYAFTFHNLGVTPEFPPATK
ncbi:MAG: S9 family peptidase [Phycisphaerae bacterium]|nr:S9 family peptidase [Gemmatimonadaceae bacterium]